MWTPLPHYPGLSQIANPMPYPSTSKLSSTSHNDSYPDGSPTSPIFLTTPTHPGPHWHHHPRVTQAIAPVAQASLANTTIPTPHSSSKSSVTSRSPSDSGRGTNLTRHHLPTPPGSEPGFIADFDNMSVSRSSTSSASSGRGHAPHPWIPTGGFHLPDLSSLTDTVAYEMWKNTLVSSI